ncbi:hypothetical protein AKJ52_01580 [candidate division MSBL1 archaeon SCGC-AAA382C18]|uniref:Phosphofructokinase domain-containing protein n=1 Tax=candidate division MSBL1 archaeon SCGC-AAA382C18 TaxID=1698281 RepID=A0A133VK33_9EURY|nr:hypothetical protein AKJ52_01580 [candidate division MSBL1 archaeon SCGC-AAA382C18]
MRIAVLTGGGHVSGLNAGIGGITKEARDKNWDVLGSFYGWEGMEKENFLELDEKNTDSIKNYGGSVLGSGRWKPDLSKVMKTVEDYDIDGIVALGGDDTLSVLRELWEEHRLPCAGWPKTMDNDLGGTYFSLGYPKAVKVSAQTTSDAFDVASTHRRIALVSLFGRATDWVAAGAAAYGNADMIVPGEKETNLEEIYEKAKDLFSKNEDRYGRPCAVIVVAEGASINGLETHVKSEDVHMDDFEHPKLDPQDLVSSLSDAITYLSKEDGKKINTGPITLTYELRNGKPLDICKDYGYECGKKCVQMLDEGKHSKMAAIERKGDEIFVGESELAEAVNRKEVKDTDYMDYDNYKVTDSFLEYASPFMGEKYERDVRMLSPD